MPAKDYTSDSNESKKSQKQVFAHSGNQNVDQLGDEIENELPAKHGRQMSHVPPFYHGYSNSIFPNDMQHTSNKSQSDLYFLQSPDVSGSQDNEERPITSYRLNSAPSIPSASASHNNDNGQIGGEDQNSRPAISRTHSLADIYSPGGHESQTKRAKTSERGFGQSEESGSIKDNSRYPNDPQYRKNISSGDSGGEGLVFGSPGPPLWKDPNNQNQKLLHYKYIGLGIGNTDHEHLPIAQEYMDEEVEPDPELDDDQDSKSNLEKMSEESYKAERRVMDLHEKGYYEGEAVESTSQSLSNDLYQVDHSVHPGKYGMKDAHEAEYQRKINDNTNNDSMAHEIEHDSREELPEPSTSNTENKELVYVHPDQSAISNPRSTNASAAARRSLSPSMHSASPHFAPNQRPQSRVSQGHGGPPNYLNPQFVPMNMGPMPPPPPGVAYPMHPMSPQVPPGFLPMEYTPNIESQSRFPPPGPPPPGFAISQPPYNLPFDHPSIHDGGVIDDGVGYPHPPEFHPQLYPRHPPHPMMQNRMIDGMVMSPHPSEFEGEFQRPDPYYIPGPPPPGTALPPDSSNLQPGKHPQEYYYPMSDNFHGMPGPPGAPPMGQVGPIPPEAMENEIPLEGGPPPGSEMGPIPFAHSPAIGPGGIPLPPPPPGAIPSGAMPIPIPVPVQEPGMGPPVPFPGPMFGPPPPSMAGPPPPPSGFPPPPPGEGPVPFDHTGPPPPVTEASGNVIPGMYPPPPGSVPFGQFNSGQPPPLPPGAAPYPPYEEQDPPPLAQQNPSMSIHDEAYMDEMDDMEGVEENSDESLMSVPGHEYEPNANIPWDEEFSEDLIRIMDLAERHKWKYMSEVLSHSQDKRIPLRACKNKFESMFGEAESSSLLHSSLFYVAYRSGWQAIRGERTFEERGDTPSAEYLAGRHEDSDDIDSNTFPNISHEKPPAENFLNPELKNQIDKTLESENDLAGEE